MKFEWKHPDATTSDRFEFEYSFVTKNASLGKCFHCNAFTRWTDVRLEKMVCSEECCGSIWKSYKENEKKETQYEKFDVYRKKAEQELEAACRCDNKSKDIIIVVRNQLSYVKEAIESVRMFTTNYKLWIWDNGSNLETQNYLDRLTKEYNDQCQDGKLDWEVEVWRSEVNIGFIEPNNHLAEIGVSDYIIPLNSDTKVFEHWDTAQLAHLQNNPQVKQVGYWGGHLGPDGRGFGGDNGSEVDYIPGWCFCISRETFGQFGLFNKQLKFAYCEDADLSLRLKEAGHEIFALHIPLVYHHQNKTINEVEKEGEIDLQSTFQFNHRYLESRWKDYLENNRVLVKRKRKE